MLTALGEMLGAAYKGALVAANIHITSAQITAYKRISRFSRSELWWFQREMRRRDRSLKGNPNTNLKNGVVVKNTEEITRFSGADRWERRNHVTKLAATYSYVIARVGTALLSHNRVRLGV
jgi:hypothetical protein